MKLKTLKDLEDVMTSGVGFVDVEDLKQEAIKCLRSERIKKMSATDFILWWCDITEEDLK